jgi:hypothetical protein
MSESSWHGLGGSKDGMTNVTYIIQNVCMCVCLYINVCIYVCVCLYICVCMCMCVYICIYIYVYVCLYRGADKSLTLPTSRCSLFDGENLSFDASLVIYINSTNISPIMVMNRIYEHQNLLSL